MVHSSLWEKQFGVEPVYNKEHLVYSCHRSGRGGGGPLTFADSLDWRKKIKNVVLCADNFIEKYLGDI